MKRGKILRVLSVILLMVWLFCHRGSKDPGSLARSFYLRLFRDSAARQVFGLEEEEVVAVFGQTDEVDAAV